MLLQLLSVLLGERFLGEHPEFERSLGNFLLPLVGFLDLVDEGQGWDDFIFDVFDFVPGTGNDLSAVTRDDVRLFQLTESLADIPYLITSLGAIYQIAVPNDSAMRDRVGSVPGRLDVVMGQMLE